jgi:hypothetical protein
MARWRTVALTSRDVPLKRFSVERFGAKFLIKINGEPRTLVDNITMEIGAPALVVGVQYEMCRAGQGFWREAAVSALVIYAMAAVCAAPLIRCLHPRRISKRVNFFLKSG